MSCHPDKLGMRYNPALSIEQKVKFSRTDPVFNRVTYLDTTVPLVTSFTNMV